MVSLSSCLEDGNAFSRDDRFLLSSTLCLLCTLRSFDLCLEAADEADVDLEGPGNGPKAVARHRRAHDPVLGGVVKCGGHQLVS